MRKYDDTVVAMVVIADEQNPDVQVKVKAAWFGMPEPSYRWIVKEAKRPFSAESAKRREMRERAIGYYPTFTQVTIAKILGISRGTLRRWLIEAGKIKAREYDNEKHCERCEIVVEDDHRLCDWCRGELIAGRLHSGGELPLSRIVELIGEQQWMILETEGLPSA